MKKRSQVLIIGHLIALLFSTTLLVAQNSIFKAGATVGINYSQIDGDHQSGYDRKGFSFGLRGGFVVNKRLDIMSELLYLEKGARPDKSNTTYDTKVATIGLQYAEVPLLIVHHLKKNDQDFYQWSINAGLSYGRLLKSTATVTQRFKLDTVITKSLSQEFFKKQDLAFIFGIDYNIRPHFGIRFRSSFSLNNMFENLNPERATNGAIKRDAYLAFRNYFISFQGFYDFIAPKFKKPKKRQATRSK